MSDCEPPTLRAIGKSQLLVDSIIHQAQVAAADGILKAELLVKLSKELEEENARDSPPSLHNLCAAVAATQYAIKSLATDHPARRGFLISLSNLLWQRKDHGDAPASDVDIAIELLEEACTIPASSSWEEKVSELERLSALHEERFECQHRVEDLQQAIHYLEQVADLSPKEAQGQVRANISSLWLRVRKTVPCVVEVPFSHLSAAPLSYAGVPRCRFRFLDCRAFVDRKVLRVLEFAQLPLQRYIAVSYVWRGIGPQVDAAPKSPATISIRGVSDADPISIEVLRLACVSALTSECELLWLDGLCIIQDSDIDKSWQIQQMHSIYKSCKSCLVIPGGLSRLVKLTEETFWIHRAWTLQEAVAPRSSECLFAWSNAVKKLNITTRAIEPDRAVTAPIERLLEIALQNVEKAQPTPAPATNLFFSFLSPPPPPAPRPIEINLLGSPTASTAHMRALVGAIKLRDKPEGQGISIWRAAVLRSASRPIDRIFSIMGLFGVTLDPMQFDVGDWRGAALALMRAVLDAGRSAEWLGVAPGRRVDSVLSMLPGGQGAWKAREGDGEGEWAAGWWLRGVPRGMVDELGYFKFKALAASVRMVESLLPASASDGEWVMDNELYHRRYSSILRSSEKSVRVRFRTINRKQWEVLPALEGPVLAVYIGEKVEITMSFWSLPSTIPFWNHRNALKSHTRDSVLMLVKKQDADRFCIIGYAFVNNRMLNESAWVKRTLHVK